MTNVEKQGTAKSKECFFLFLGWILGWISVLSFEVENTERSSFHQQRVFFVC